MDTGRESRDDLNFSLQWPGADIESAEGSEVEPANGSTSSGAREAAGTRDSGGADIPVSGASDVEAIARIVSASLSRQLADSTARSTRALNAWVGAFDDRLGAIERKLDAVLERETADADQNRAEVLERLYELTRQVETLRRRFALRARGDQSGSEPSDDTGSSGAARRGKSADTPVRSRRRATRT